VSGAGFRFAVAVEVPAGNLEHGLVEKVIAVPPEVAEEGDPLGMTQQPGRFMVR
jgi:hypothetical protein